MSRREKSGVCEHGLGNGPHLADWLHLEVLGPVANAMPAAAGGLVDAMKPLARAARKTLLKPGTRRVALTCSPKPRRVPPQAPYSVLITGSTKGAGLHALRPCSQSDTHLGLQAVPDACDARSRGTGLGKALAAEFLKAGDRVIVSSRSGEPGSAGP